LIDEIHYLKSISIPMGYLLFQGAGASSGQGIAAPWCVDTWGIDGGLSSHYPVSIKDMQNAIGIPLQLLFVQILWTQLVLVLHKQLLQG
jgi:hypothetical protein